MTRTYMRRKLTGMVAPSTLRRLALAGMVALLVGGAPLAQTPEPAQDDSIETVRTHANAGDAAAQFQLGRMYDYGWGVPQDFVEAAAWYRKAAEQGHADAQVTLGTMYRRGWGVPQDDVEWVNWSGKAAEQGHSAAQAALAFTSYRCGWCVAQTLAREWFQKTIEALRTRANAGDAAAQVTLGTRYSRGWGVPQDDVEAVAWYRKAAEQGDAAAQFQLGQMYGSPSRPSATVEEVAWYRKAAEQGYVAAQFQLGQMYSFGWVVPEDIVEAAAWFRKAAEQGDAGAQFRIGGMYRRGAGVPQDDVEAVAWFRKAVEQGSLSAQVALGEMYADGRGVPQDDVEAYKWLHRAFTTAHEGARRAGDGGNVPDVEEARDPVAGRLTPEQRAEGEKRAREWFPAHPRD